jgi:7-cyano-7-deazaguanine synthase
MANLATKQGVEGHKLSILTPLIDLNKSEIIKIGLSLGVDYSLTTTCYQANEKGEACGVCDACEYRKLGFESAGIADPTRYE